MCFSDQQGRVGGAVRFGKFILVVLLVWLLPSAWLPLFGYIYEVPYTLDTVDAANVDSRMLSIRSAAFMTVIYFVLSYLRHQRPLSSVLPILVFCYWLIVFRCAYLFVYPSPWTEWVLVLVFVVMSVFLTIEHLRDSNRIFKDSW